MSKLILAKATTAYRETAVPKKGDLFFDVDLNKLVVGDGVTPGGIVIDVSGGTGNVTGGFGINVVDNEVSLKRFDAIESLVSGGTVQAGHAYKLNATSASGTTIFAEWFANDTFARNPAHIQIMVNGVGYLHLGQKTTAGSETAPFTLVGALEPDAMNNVTVRFHDGTAVMTVEDHIGGYVVISASGSTAGTLVYALTNTGDDASPYITFSSELNGTPIDLAGTTVTTERHVVGNGYEETILGGTINVVGSTASLTLAALGLNNTVVSSGTLTLGDVYIPNGATVAVSGGGLAVEKVTGNGGVIELEGANAKIITNATVSGVDFVCSGVYTSQGGGINVANVSASLFDCSITGASASQQGGGIFTDGIFTISGCTITNNRGSIGGGVYIRKDSEIVSSLIVGNISPTFGRDDIFSYGSNTTVTISASTVGVIIAGGSSHIKLTGSNRIENVPSYGDGNLILASGAIVDLTGNTNATPIAPGGGVIVSGACTVINSAGASVSIAGGTYTQINNDGTTE